MLYEYECECGENATAFRHMDDRDDAPECQCGKRMDRIEIPSSVTMDPVGGYQMGAVTKSGRVIPGNFGQAPKKGKWHRP